MPTFPFVFLSNVDQFDLTGRYAALSLGGVDRLATASTKQFRQHQISLLARRSRCYAALVGGAWG
jgi:hypothetical protein